MIHATRRSASPDEDDDQVSVIDLTEDVEPEEPLNREAPTSLAARFRNLCQASPEPPQFAPPRSPVVLHRITGRPLVPQPQHPPPSDEGMRRTPVVTDSGTNRPTKRTRSLPVRSCDQCRISKQKCDRGRPCSACTMRKIVCTWKEAGNTAPDPLNRKLAHNNAEIVRLEKEANTLARLLRLTPAEFDLFRLEARRLVDGGRGQPTALPPLVPTTKRSRDSEEEGARRERVVKIARREEVRPKQYPSNRFSLVATDPSDPRAPVASIRTPHGFYRLVKGKRPRGSDPDFPPVRPSSSSVVGVRKSPSMSTSRTRVTVDSRSHAAAQETSSSMTSRALVSPRASSYSTLPPLQFSSLTGSRPTPPTIPPNPFSHPSQAKAHVSTPSQSPPRRHPHYFLPTPNYSSAPGSDAFFPLTVTATKPLYTSSSYHSFPSFSATPLQAQPYTSLVAVRDERPRADELEEEEPNESNEPEEEPRDSASEGAEEEDDEIVIVKLERDLSPPIPPPASAKIVLPSLTRLLNYD